MATWNSAKTGNWTAEDTWGATWVASTAYAVGDRCTPSTLNSHTYECTTAGTSDTTEPTWPTTNGDTVTDGGAVWTCRDGYPNANGDVVNLGHTVTYDLGDSTVTFGNITINSGGVLTFPSSANSTLYVGDTSGSNNASITINSGGELRIGTSSTPIGSAYHAIIYFQRSAAGYSLVLNDGGILNVYGDTAYYGSTYDDRYASLNEDWTSGQTLYIKGDYSSKWQSGQKFWIHENGDYSNYTTDAHIYTIDTVGAYDSTNDKTPITIVEAAPNLTFNAVYNGWTSKLILLSRNVELSDPNSSWDVNGFGSYTEVIRFDNNQGDSNVNIQLNNVIMRGWSYGMDGGSGTIGEGIVFLNCDYSLHSTSNIDLNGDFVSINKTMYNVNWAHLEGCMVSSGTVEYSMNITELYADFIGNNFCMYYGHNIKVRGNFVANNYIIYWGDTFQLDWVKFYSNAGKLNYPTCVLLKNCDIGTTRIDVDHAGDSITLENCIMNGVQRELRIYNYAGNFLPLVSGDTDWQTPPSGNSWILEATPSANCSDVLPSHRMEMIPLNLKYMAQWIASGTKTITFKVYPHGWSALNQDNLFLEAWYLDSASGVSMTKAVTGSTTFSNDSWQDLSVTVTPAQDGIVYFNLVLAKYEASAYVLIDPVWSVS